MSFISSKYVTDRSHSLDSLAYFRSNSNSHQHYKKILSNFIQI